MHHCIFRYLDLQTAMRPRVLLESPDRTETENKWKQEDRQKDSSRICGLIQEVCERDDPLVWKIAFE